MMRVFVVSIVFMCVSSLVHGMEMDSSGTCDHDLGLYRVPSCQPSDRPVTAAHLAEIMPTEQCVSHGRITALVVQELKEWHRKLSQLAIDMQEVTMMRTDVSDALGGAHVTGDTIHVDGIDLGQNTLADGAVVVIKKRDEDSPAVVLLKTFVPYLADSWAFKNRCGQVAYDFMHDRGAYEGGTAVHDRLRGVRLAVLHPGAVAVGDNVEILSRDEGEALLAQMQLHDKAAALIDESLPIAHKILVQYQKNKDERALMQQTAESNPYTSWSGITCITGVVAVMVLILVGGSF